MSQNDKDLSEAFRVEKHTEIFASMCPDEILDHYDDYSTRIYHTTLMLGDVSGFTEVAEKYTYSGKGGPSRLTETLNNYIGAMVQEILSRRGDVLKFSGDAFIVSWKLEDGMAMRDLATEAIQTACVIQQHFGTYETDVGVTLRVKLAIATGKTYFTSIGDPHRISHYIITGKPVWEAKFAESLCRGGDILVTPSTWLLVNPDDYVFKILSDETHILVIASATTWEQPRESYQDGIPNSERTSESWSDNLDLLPTNFGQRFSQGLSVIEPRGNHFNIDYSLRPKVIMVSKKHLKNELRTYMLAPVIRSVELDEPLEHLTEIRQVVIVFVNVTTDAVNRRLILLVNEAYKLLYSIVTEMHGCVNKTNLFDKDLMFLCIFGLRGNKQELESQIALQCACKIRASLLALENILSVSIGVSTGLTYCGVVGHILRREYSVIGMPVNRAARLMVAYVNKVICDRESFLHSRLDANHFILQDQVPLKGITNVGPIYEFLEEARIDKEKVAPILYPLLGRRSELRVFKMLVARATRKWNETKENPLNNINSLLLLRGEPRVGKTRLLDEISRIIPKDIACNYITLATTDRHIPFTLIHTIFYGPLNFTRTSTSENREEAITGRLASQINPEKFYVLNPVFNVNFKINEKFSVPDNREILRQIVQKLTENCFTDLWVVIIDNIDYADEESLDLMTTIISTNRMILVVSFGSSTRGINPAILRSGRTLYLYGLDKWYHAGLACQFLKVVAIPAELEKFIQERSGGNPGWIESYLVSVKQIGGIELKKVSRKEIREMGLVAPPSRMITTYRPSEIDIANIPDDMTERTDSWRMYEACYGGSTTNLLENSTDEEVFVCTISRDFQIEDVSPVLTADVIFLKLFDSLKPLDQIILKSAAVLGDTVGRKLLENLMEKTSIRDIGLAITNLFEMKILGCAAGDFSRSTKLITLSRAVRSLSEDAAIQCACRNLHIQDELDDLPRYASCRLLRFKISKFREATYRLLTENQKIEFHMKALKYLRRNTRKCQSCGGDFFTNILSHQSYHANLQDSKKNLYDIDNIDYEDFETTRVSFTVKKSSSGKKKLSRHIVTDESDIPPKTFANFDFTNCQCNLILITVYMQILDHCRGINHPIKVLVTILEFTEVLLATLNIPQALKLLSEANEVLNHAFKSRNDEKVITPYLKSKIKTLQARCHLQNKLLDEALNNLEDSITSLGYDFPKSRLAIKLKSKLLFQQLKLMLGPLRNQTVGVSSGDSADYSDQVSKCLSQMFIIFKTRGMREHAELTAIWSLNAALASSRDFSALCSAYSNMILTAHQLRDLSVAELLENDALMLCNNRENDIELHELEGVVEVYSKICYSRLLRNYSGKNTASILGFITLRLSRAIQSVQHEIFILPRLIYVLIVECKFQEVPALLERLEFIASSDPDKSGRTWYYTLAIDIQLDTGIVVTPVAKCEQYYQEEGKTLFITRDPTAKGRYLTSMWLWHLRVGEWEAATVWQRRINSTTFPRHEPTVITSLIALKQLEGLLILYVEKVDSRSYEGIRETRQNIDKQFKAVEKLAKIVTPIVARYLLLKAYKHMIFSETRLGMKLLLQSKKIAENWGLKLISKWADYLEKAWTGLLSVDEKDKWKERCYGNISENSVDEDSVVFYTLPLPKYQGKNYAY